MQQTELVDYLTNRTQLHLDALRAAHHRLTSLAIPLTLPAGASERRIIRHHVAAHLAVVRICFDDWDLELHARELALQLYEHTLRFTA